jgi:cytosine/adenosine deaminase-related metal-dependent hydrolase
MDGGTDLTRRTLLGAGLAAGAASLSPLRAATPAEGATLALRNVRLESGYSFDDAGVSGTRTELATVTIERGLFAALLPASASLPPGAVSRDAGGLLMLPAFRDMHVHLDKNDFGGPWVAPRKRVNGIAGQIARERVLIPQLLPTLPDRADKIVRLLQRNGSTFARVQCNVDPVSGTRHIEAVKSVLDAHRGDFGHELVAFPQHGLVSAHTEKLMAQAIRAGATHVGGIDPTAVDGGMERSLDTILGIAAEHRRPIDIHLHEPDQSGIAAIRYLLDAVDRESSLKGKVTISHCFALMSIDGGELDELAGRMAANGFSITSTVPFGRRMMPIPALLAKGVPVFTGTDSVQSLWSVFGSGDVLEKAKLACQLYGWGDELAIAQSLRLATGGPVPLSPAGERLWPKRGDAADVVLVAASCSAETVARQTPRAAVLHRGNLAAGTLA